MIEPNQKRLLLRWIGWFFLMTSIILFLAQLSFLKYIPNLHQIHGATMGKISFALTFLFASYVTQAMILAFAAALITALLTLLIPRRSLCFILAIVLSSALIIAQIIDTITFNLYHSHEITIGMQVFETGAFDQVIPMSFKEIWVLAMIAVVVFLIQLGIATWVWQRIKKNTPGRTRIWISTFIVTCFCFSYGTMAGVISVPVRYQINNTAGLLLLKTARLVPYYSDAFEAIMPINNLYKRTIDTSKGWLSYQTRQPALPMHYPLKPLHCSPTKLPNIIFLVIDTWRFDAMSKRITPNIYHFAANTLQFNDHWSGGNCTQTGIFSLFYGIPANYWHATIADKKGPVFIKTLQKNHYQLRFFASATLKFPAFDKNVLIDVKHLTMETKGKNTLDRDKRITQRFKKFLKTRDKKRPFFSFVFYDAAHNYCDGGEQTHQAPFKPAVKECARFALTKDSNPIPYLNRYHNAVHFIDAEVGQVLKALAQQGLYKNTIIIITADHGEQFNDEKLGYWSHNSAYSPYQLHVPMLVYWPGQNPRTITYFSTHFDVVPTLMERIFLCAGSTKNYSIGQSMFEPDRSTYTISGNYTSYAVLTHKRHTTFYPNGAYAIKTPMSQQAPNAAINVPLIKKANRDLKRYFR